MEENNKNKKVRNCPFCGLEVDSNACPECNIFIDDTPPLVRKEDNEDDEEYNWREHKR